MTSFKPRRLRARRRGVQRRAHPPFRDDAVHEMARDPLETEFVGDFDKSLFERLRALRRAIADERHLPAFMILSDSTLRALARLRPASSEDLLQVPGIGPVKAKAYGPRFLDAIREASPRYES